MSETIDFAVIILIVFYFILFCFIATHILCRCKTEMETKVCAWDEMSFLSDNVYHPKEFFCKLLLSKKLEAHR